jgi:thioredoxin-like negative regulator of GroEL
LGEAARLYQLGVDDIHAGAYFAAAKAVDQAMQLAPHFSPAGARLAESWLELDLPEKAAREFLPVRRENNADQAERFSIATATFRRNPE